MQENNFERDVRQKLDELNLTPSEPVWQRVEAAIRKKKERRLVLWLLPLLLLTGSLVWWQATPWENEKGSQRARQQVQKEPAFSKPHAKAAEQEKDIQAKEPPTQQNTTHVTKADQAYQNVQASVQVTPKRKIFKNIKTSHPVISKSAEAERITNANDSRTEVGKDAEINSGRAVPEKLLTKGAQPPTIAETKSDAAPIDTSSKTTVLKDDSLQKAAPPVRVNQKTKWRWSIASRIGASNLRNGLFGPSSNKALQPDRMQLDTEAGQSCMPCTANANYTFRNTNVSVPTSGMQFSIGAGAKKWLYRKTHLTTGLLYSYYSYYLVVGSEVPANFSNSSARLDVRKMYRNIGAQNQFRNAFHIIELPVGLEHQLLKRRPLHLQYGVTLQQTIASRALQFDSQTNTYYQTSEGLRKTGFGLFAGMDYTIWKGTGFSIQAGPHLQYGLRNIFKNTSRSHLVSGGVAINMAF